MDLQPNLTPHWIDVPETEGADGGPVRFYVRPLTQPQVNELLPTFERVSDIASRPTQRTFYLAACMGLETTRKIENLTINGEKAKWPKHRDVIPQEWLVSVGALLVMEVWGDVAEDDEKNS